MYQIEELEIIKLYYSTTHKEDLINKLDNKHKWKSIVWTANKLGLNKPKIRKSKLIPLLEDNNINYYWYGFILADGHISKQSHIEITLSNKDRVHLEKISILLKVPIYDHNNLSSINFMDLRGTEILRNKLDINNNKTINPPKLNQLKILNDNEYFLSLFIGFVDGDGHIAIKSTGKFQYLKIHVHSNWLNNMEYISKELKNRFDITTQVKICKRGYTEFIMCRQDDYKKLKQFIKEKQLPILERKWL